MHQITLDNRTYERLLVAARKHGFPGVPEYLSDLTAEDDALAMTPEIRKALDEGLEDIQAGRVVTMDEAIRNLETYKKQWRANHDG